MTSEALPTVSLCKIAWCSVAETLTLLYVDDRHLIVSRSCVHDPHSCSSRDINVELFARSRAPLSPAELTRLSAVLRRTCFEFSEFTQLYDAGKPFLCTV